MKTWTISKIKENLKRNDEWVYRAVVAIYNKQTEEEQFSEDTTEHNGIGFNSFDAHILSSFAKQIIKWENNHNCNKFREPLSKKQLLVARKKILKYSNQLTKIANNEL